MKIPLYVAAGLIALTVISFIASQCESQTVKTISAPLQGKDSDPRYVPHDDELAELLVGRWYHQGQLPNRKFFRFEKEYFQNGTAEGWMTIYAEKNDGTRGEQMQKATFTSKWRIDGTVIVIWDMNSKPAGYLDPTEVDRDTVLSIGGKYIEYRTEKGEYGKQEKMTVGLN